MEEARLETIIDGSDEQKDLGRRERKKIETRQALEEAALELFETKGYDQTTIEDITEAVDVSSRTFFRYFDSKEAVLFGNWQSYMSGISEMLKNRPLEETPLEAMKEFSLLYAQVVETLKPRMLFIKKLSDISTTIGDYEREIMCPIIEDVLAAAFADRMGVDINADMKPRIYAGVSIVALNVAKLQWIESDGKKPFYKFVEEAFDIVGCA
ncbi:MAG: TetR family transcriptional regulator [Actinobacteria bacterium]|nr:TetR family transcriptional regulator [Actinomycetota bacterium]